MEQSKDKAQDFISNLSAIYNKEFELKKIPKKTIIQRPGEYTKMAYFVKKGLLRSYIVDEKGKEHVFIFAPEDWIIADIEARVSDAPTELYIETIENSEVYIIDGKDLDYSKALNSSDLSEFNKLLKRISVLQRRVIMFMSYSAIKRYEHFKETYPQIINRAPQKMIASYLGITPEALSKIRGEIARQK